MKIIFKNLILIFIFFISNYNIAYGEKYLEVIKLYDLYSQEILDIDQLNSGLEKMNLNSENIKNLISLRKSDIISEDDFINGIKKILEEVSSLENELKENESDISKQDIVNHEFQVEITKIHAYVISDFNYGEDSFVAAPSFDEPLEPAAEATTPPTSPKTLKKLPIVQSPERNSKFNKNCTNKHASSDCLATIPIDALDKWERDA